MAPFRWRALLCLPLLASCDAVFGLGDPPDATSTDPSGDADAALDPRRVVGAARTAASITILGAFRCDNLRLCSRAP